MKMECEIPDDAVEAIRQIGYRVIGIGYPEPEQYFAYFDDGRYEVAQCKIASRSLRLRVIVEPIPKPSRVWICGQPNGSVTMFINCEPQPNNNPPGWADNSTSGDSIDIGFIVTQSQIWPNETDYTKMIGEFITLTNQTKPATLS